MSESGILLDYTGLIDNGKIDFLLTRLKRTQAFIELQKTAARRLYAVLVECLENIARYSSKVYPADWKSLPFISVEITNEKIIIRAGNPIEKVKTRFLAEKLREVNKLDKNVLSSKYESIINREPLIDENGAGLGFILIRLRSGNKIDFRFTDVNQDTSYFLMQTSINKSVMRKLIIDQTANSPGVIFDPDNNIFEISGESRPPDVPFFYGEILRWMDEYSKYIIKYKDLADPVVFNLDFEYFNSSSAKNILDLCKQIANIRLKGKDVKVRWHYVADDMDMLEVGKEMSRMAKFPFEFIQRS
jgi:hypothetical protein